MDAQKSAGPDSGIVARERILRQWRQLDTRETEGAQRRRDRSLTELVPLVLGGLRLEERVMESQISQLWQQIIDPVLAKHSQPVGLVKGTLFVTVDSNVWLSEILRYRRSEILQRLQDAFGKNRIEKISFRLG
jgi:predicted nucleic acid-binding Zn ribbon protein